MQELKVTSDTASQVDSDLVAKKATPLAATVQTRTQAGSKAAVVGMGGAGFHPAVAKHLATQQPEKR